MEPVLSTESRLLSVLDELKQREPIFHRPEHGTTREDFEKMTDIGFWEVGASGRRYSREFVLDTLEERYSHPVKESWESKDFHCREIAPGNYLITYTLLQGARLTRRSTIWRRSTQGWQVLYHQGTIVQEP